MMTQPLIWSALFLSVTWLVAGCSETEPVSASTLASPQRHDLTASPDRERAPAAHPAAAGEQVFSGHGFALHEQADTDSAVYTLTALGGAIELGAYPRSGLSGVEALGPGRSLVRVRYSMGHGTGVYHHREVLIFLTQGLPPAMADVYCCGFVDGSWGLGSDLAAEIVLISRDGQTVELRYRYEQGEKIRHDVDTVTLSDSPPEPHHFKPVMLAMGFDPAFWNSPE